MALTFDMHVSKSLVGYVQLGLQRFFMVLGTFDLKSGCFISKMLLQQRLQLKFHFCALFFIPHRLRIILFKGICPILVHTFVSFFLLRSQLRSSQVSVHGGRQVYSGPGCSRSLTTVPFLGQAIHRGLLLVKISFFHGLVLDRSLVGSVHESVGRNGTLSRLEGTYMVQFGVGCVLVTSDCQVSKVAEFGGFGRLWSLFFLSSCIGIQSLFSSLQLHLFIKAALLGLLKIIFVLELRLIFWLSFSVSAGVEFGFVGGRCCLWRQHFASHFVLFLTKLRIFRIVGSFSEFNFGHVPLE